MQTRRKIIGAIGALAGIALAVTTAVLPASAAKPVKGGGEESSTISSVSCSAMNGESITAEKPSVNVGMTAGQSLRITVSPARTGDTIYLTTGSSLYDITVWPSAPAPSGIAFTAKLSAVYNVGLSLSTSGTRPSSITWTFECSSGGSGGGLAAPDADADGDGVADSADVCAGTVLPDSVRKAAGSYYANKNGVFVDGAGVKAGVTVAETGGCSAKQIATESGLKKGQSRSGISLALLESWAAKH